jgi:hypothetical protein
VDVLSKLERLEELVLVWNEKDRYLHKTSATTCAQLLVDIWAMVSSSLRSLTLHMSLFNLLDALRLSPNLKALEELHISVTPEKVAFNLVATALIPFINKLASKLIAFSFTSFQMSHEFSLGPLLQNMGPTPLLRRLTLRLNLTYGLNEQRALRTFLQNRDTIRSLDLRYYAGLDHWEFPHVFIGEAFTFPQLKNLTLGLGRLPIDPPIFLPDLQHYVSQFSGAALSHLTFPDRMFQTSQLHAVLVAFQVTLRSLAISVLDITPELLYKIASLLPSLRDLALRARDISSCFFPYNKNDEVKVSVRNR